MNCEIFDMLYLRANGIFACNCSAGDQLELGRVTQAMLPFQGAKYELMAEQFSKDIPPWGDICRNCVFFREHEPFHRRHQNKIIEKFHIEPSLACTLRCPGCNRVHQIKIREGDVFLSVEHLRQLLSSMKGDGYTICYFFLSGAGEPCSHPQLSSVIRAFRDFYPNSQVIVNTNGNYKFSDVFCEGIYPDRMIVSVDGARQSSYEQYRIRGDMEKALQFMVDAKKVSSGKVVVEWKYILFTYNDSDEELIEAQRKAESMGIDSLQYVLTHTKEKSVRFTIDNIHTIPMVSPLAYVETTPHLYHAKTGLRLLGPAHSDLSESFAHRDKVKIVVDKISLFSGENAVITGWAMENIGANPKDLKVLLNGKLCGTAMTLQARPDVLKAFPQSGNPNSGFRAYIRLLEPVKAGPVDFGFKFTAQSGQEYTYTLACEVLASTDSDYNRDAKA